MKPTRIRNQNGFSLIEVVIAMSILSIGILATGQMLYMSLRTNSTGNEVTEATMLAQSWIENLKNTPDVSTLRDNENLRQEYSGLDQDGNPGGIYTVYETIWDPTDDNDSRQIRLEVEWNRVSGTKIIEFNTLTQGNGI